MRRGRAGQRIEAGLSRGEKLNAAEDRHDAQRELGGSPRTAEGQNHLLEANLRLVVSAGQALHRPRHAFLDLDPRRQTGLDPCGREVRPPAGAKFRPTPRGGSGQAITGDGRSGPDHRIPVHSAESITKLCLGSARCSRTWVESPPREELAGELDADPQRKAAPKSVTSTAGRESSPPHPGEGWRQRSGVTIRGPAAVVPGRRRELPTLPRSSCTSVLETRSGAFEAGAVLMRFWPQSDGSAGRPRDEIGQGLLWRSPAERIPADRVHDDESKLGVTSPAAASSYGLD